ncbi:MAG: hypothetical protein K1Y36_23030 [Blastocatellia bacterium]|nr:hypothetical protein [Blastocatellia bacterium]
MLFSAFRIACLGGLLGLSFTVSVFSQEPTQPPAPASQTPASQTSKRQKELQAQTDLLLQEILTDTKQLRSAENRMRVLIETAELLWDRDRDLAKALFSDAVNSFGGVIKERAPAEEDDEPDLTANIYVEVLQRISQKDVALAYSLLQSTRVTFFPAPAPNDTQMLNEFEFNLFKQVAANDPQALFKYAKEALAKGISDSVLGMVDELNQKDPKLASELASDLIAKLKSDPGKSRREVTRLALQILGKVFPAMYTDPNAQAEPAALPKGLPLDAQARRDLLALIQQAVAQIDFGSPFEGDTWSLFRNLKNILPELERVSPTLGQMLRAKNAEYERLYGGLEKARSEMVSLMSKGTTQSFLERANRTGNEQFVAMAISKAMSEGNYDQAAQIARQKITDPTMRKEYLDNIERQKVETTVQTGEVAEARKAVYSIKSKHQRVQMLIALAGTAAAKQDLKTAAELVREAQLQLPPRPENLGQFQLFLEITKVYARIDSNQGFEVAELLVDQVNELTGAMATLDGFGYGASQRLRFNEFSLDRGQQAVSMLADWVETVTTLAPADVPRAKAVCERVARVELRTFARLRLGECLVNETSRVAAERETDEKSSASPR